MTTPRQSVGRSVIIPAAGLGTRLSPLTLGTAKELLPLGAYPALTASLLEARAANAHEIVVVTSADKPQLARFFAELRTLGRFIESGVTPSAAGAGLPAAGRQPEVKTRQRMARGGDARIVAVQPRTPRTDHERSPQPRMSASTRCQVVVRSRI